MKKKVGVVLLAGIMTVGILPTATMAHSSPWFANENHHSNYYKEHIIDYIVRDRNNNKLNSSDYDITIRDKDGKIVNNSRHLDSGTYELRLSKPGLFDIVKEFTITDSHDRNITLNIHADRNYGDIYFGDKYYGYKHGNNDISFSDVRLNNSNVNGYTEPNAIVKLYDGNDRYLKQASADSRGYFTINYNFYFSNNGYNKSYYTLRPDDITRISVSGKDAPANTRVYVYDRNGRELGSRYSDNNGNYNIGGLNIYDTRDIVVTTASYYSDNYTYNRDRSSYYLVASKSGYDSRKYYLDNRDSGRIENAKKVSVNTAVVGTSFINGSNATPNSTVIVKSGSTTLGNATADANGYFVVYLNRSIIAGEKLSIINKTGSNEVTTEYEVAGSKKDTSANSSFKTEFTIGSGKMQKTINGNTTVTWMDVAPYIKESRTMMPIRFVAEALGYTVTFNDVTRMASFVNGDMTLMFGIDEDKYFVNGAEKTFEVKPEIKSGRTMLPISEIGRALGLTQGNKGEGKNIEWDASTRTVTIEK